PVQRETGVLGQIAAFVSTVKAQGRGALHLHIILWLSGSLKADVMKEQLSNNEFRDTIKHFISVNIHAHIPDVPG
ncbi:hypothetical protein H4582DRAFT_1775609, partial [Lactarius indigo]